MVTVSIHQPNYIPWLGYFYKVFESDTFVFLDDVQYSNKGMHNYHYIKTPQGPFRMKIPVNEAFGDKIFSVSSKDNSGWKEKHLKTITSNYKRAAFFDEIYNDLSNLLTVSYPNIAVMNAAIIKFISKKFGFKTSFIESSSLNINKNSEEKIIEICRLLNANIYNSGTGAREYQNEVNFAKEGIILQYTQFKPFIYPQLWGAFQSNVTVIDYLMHCGYDWNRVVENQTNNQKCNA